MPALRFCFPRRVGRGNGASFWRGKIVGAREGGVWGKSLRLIRLHAADVVYNNGSVVKNFESVLPEYCSVAAYIAAVAANYSSVVCNITSDSQNSGPESSNTNNLAIE